MKILLVADGRSPITRRWIEELLISTHEVSLVSTFPCDQPGGLTYFNVLPICFSKYAGSQVGRGSGENTVQSSGLKHQLKGFLKRYRKVFQALRYWIGPPTLWWYRPQLRQIIADLQPDLVHALRIPFEGMLSLVCPKQIPLAVSIWGDDLTLHGPKNAWMRTLTNRVLKRADGLITDVDRDVDLAVEWGYSAEKPVLVVLTSGGIDFEKLAAVRNAVVDPLIAELPQDAVWVVNPRGIRPGYVRNDTFFAAIPKVLAKTDKSVIFICPSMKNQPQALEWVTEYGIESSVRLLPFLSQAQLWQLLSRTTVMVSVTEHDGTPNSLLESMSLGAFPIVGDIESLREWINDGENGYLVDPSDPDSLAQTILLAFGDHALRKQAQEINLELVQSRASNSVVRKLRDEFYSKIV